MGNLLEIGCRSVRVDCGKRMFGCNAMDILMFKDDAVHYDCSFTLFIDTFSHDKSCGHLEPRR